MAYLKNLAETISKDPNTTNVLMALVDPEHSILDNKIIKAILRNEADLITEDKCLLGFLIQLAKQHDDHYIKLPHYVNLGKRKLKDNELFVGDNGKFGILLNIVSNKKTFNFSVRLKDMTIIKYNLELKKQERGSFRSFTLSDKYGNISENWRTMKVFQMHEERKIFDNHDKAISVKQETFIGKKIGQELCQIRYFLINCFINRLKAERAYWEEMKQVASERIANFDAKYELARIKEEMKEMEK